MINVSDLKPGVTFQLDGNLYVVLDYSHNKTARAAANIKVKMKNLRTGSTTELTFGGNDKVKRAQIDKKEMQYLYNTGDAFVFMDGETYEQIEIPAENLEWEKNFLKESATATIRSFEGEVLGVQLPDKVTLQITEAEAAVKGDTATGATKNAVLETGFQIKAALHSRLPDRRHDPRPARCQSAQRLPAKRRVVYDHGEHPGMHGRPDDRHRADLEPDQAVRQADRRHHDHRIARHLYCGQPGIRRDLLLHRHSGLPRVHVRRHRAGDRARALAFHCQ